MCLKWVQSQSLHITLKGLNEMGVFFSWKATSSTGCSVKQVCHSLSTWLARTCFYRLSTDVVEISVFTEMKTFYRKTSAVFIYTKHFPLSLAAV